MHPSQDRRRQLGFSIIELMVALALGLVVVLALVYPYLSSKTTLTRQGQLSALENGVRAAFSFLNRDVRMAGHYGCTDNSTLRTNFATPDPTSAFVVGLEGYEAKQVSGGLTLTAGVPGNETDPAQWETNTAASPSGSGVSAAIPLAIVSGTNSSGNPAGATPGTDVLITRSAIGARLRLTADANVGANGKTVDVETPTSNGHCPGSTTALGELCQGSYALISSCTQGRVFAVDSITTGSGGTGNVVTMLGTMAADSVYVKAGSDLVPLNTVAYYVKSSQNGASTSLYRRTFDGTLSAGLEQELIDNVDTMQILYGVDTSAPADGAIDAYMRANDVADWSRVLAVRISLLLHTTDLVASDTASSLPSSAIVNGLTVTYPNGDRRDRRVFTTTIALRNRLTRF